MQFRAHDGPLADCGADPLDRSGPHIAASEYVANAGFQRQRTAGSIRSSSGASPRAGGAFLPTAAAIFFICVGVGMRQLAGRSVMPN
jgi:hypothetical protein